MALANPPRLLVLESNESDIQAVSAVAAELGIESVTSARDGKRAFALLKTGKVNFVVADLGVLEHERFVLVKAMRGDSTLANIPLLVSVAGANQQRIKTAVQAGARHFVAKPMAPEALGAKVEEMLAAPKAEKAPVDELLARKCFAKGFALLKDRKFYQAQAEFAKALKANPEFPEALKGLAEAKLGAGDHAASNALLGKAAEVYAVQDRDDEAQGLYDDLQRTNPGAPNPFHAAARHHKTTGDTQKAIQRFEKAIEAEPMNADLACELSETYEEIGESEKAVEVITDALERTGGGGKSTKAQVYFLNLTGQSWKDYCVDQEKQKRVSVIEEPEEVPEEYDEQRKATRIPLADYVLRLGKQEPLHVVNISMSGAGFKTEDEGPSPGQSFTFDLASHEVVKIKKMQARVVHATRGVSGCVFVNLSDKQKALLEKILINEKPDGYTLDTEVNFNIPMM